MKTKNQISLRFDIEAKAIKAKIRKISKDALKIDRHITRFIYVFACLLSFSPVLLFWVAPMIVIKQAASMASIMFIAWGIRLATLHYLKHVVNDLIEKFIKNSMLLGAALVHERFSESRDNLKRVKNEHDAAVQCAMANKVMFKLKEAGIPPSVRGPVVARLLNTTPLTPDNILTLLDEKQVVYLTPKEFIDYEDRITLHARVGSTVAEIANAVSLEIKNYKQATTATEKTKPEEDAANRL